MTEPNRMVNASVSESVEAVARASYGQLLAYLSRRTGDVAAAEDALAEGFRAALETWPERGIPENPSGWLLTTARRKLIDHSRREKVRTETEELLRQTTRGHAEENLPIPDERLMLLFTCAHPAIDAAVRTPLMLQTVLGLDAKQISSSFLVSPTTMGQRLSRAKTKIRAAGIRFEVPGHDELPERLDAVLSSIYAAYVTAHDSPGDDATGQGVAGADSQRRGFAREALWLASVVASLMPAEPETWGLLALIRFCESRRGARLSEHGAFVPLTEQDVATWDARLLAEAEAALGRAAELRRPGRFQLEAAIQSVHADRARTGLTDWALILKLYDELLGLSPTVGTAVGRSVAAWKVLGAKVALGEIDRLAELDVRAYQPYWAVRGHLLGELKQWPQALEAFRMALGLTTDSAVRAYLNGRLARLAEQAKG